MKLLLTIALTLLSISIGYAMLHKDENFSLEGKFVNTILDNTAQALEKEYNIRLAGMGSAMPGGIIKELTLAFNCKRHMTRESLRKLLIGCAQELLTRLEGSPSMEAKESPSSCSAKS